MIALKKAERYPIPINEGNSSVQMGAGLTRSKRGYTAAAPRTVEGLTKDQVCVKYQGKVRLIARRIYERLSSEAMMELDDLAGVGAIGLLEAFERFDQGKDVLFSTFAEYRIRGAMYDALRSDDSFTRRRRQLSRKIEGTAKILQGKLGRPPETHEMADSLEMTIEEYHKALDKVRPITHVSIHSKEQHADGESVPLIDRLVTGSQEDPDMRMTIQKVREQLAIAIEQLPEKERHCVIMYYGKGLSLAEAAKVYGVTVSRISQILSTARMRLRKRLQATVNIKNLNLELNP